MFDLDVYNRFKTIQYYIGRILQADLKMADTAPCHLLDAYRQLVQDGGCEDDHTTVSESADNIYHSDAEMRDTKCADETSAQVHQEVPTPEEDYVSVICDGETRTADIKADPQHLTDGQQSAEGPSPQRSDDHMTKEYFLNLHNLIKSEDDAAVSLRSQTTPGHRVGAGTTDECGTSPGEPSGITEDKAAEPNLHVIQPDYAADVYAPESPGTDLYNSGDVYAPERPYKCLTCDKSYTTAGQLSRHYRGHTLNLQFSCGTCGRLFERQDCLTTHQRIHSGERPYKCAVCDKAFRCLSTLTTHKTTHTGERPHKCGTCGKGFSCSSNLNKHRRVHTGEQPYRCAVCGKGFKQSSYLKMHERTHTGEKPYQCGTCGRGFSRADNLATHTRTHTGERPYKCTTCGKGFNQLASLNRHVMNIHERGKKLDS